MRVLLINRHSLAWTAGEAGSYLPVGPSARFLVTRAYAGGLAGHDPAAYPHTAVVDMERFDDLAAIIGWAIRTHAIDRVVAIHEKDMLLAARVREEFGLPGLDVATTRRFRDKVLMKQTLEESGYHNVPRYRPLNRGEVVSSVDWSGRSVVKSRWGVGSSEVRVVDSVDEANLAARELEVRSDGLEIEEFVAGAMYHCDSVVVNGQVRFAAVSEYIAAPGRYHAGGMAGSVVRLDGELRSRLLEHNARVLTLLRLDAGVTHVEFFHRPDGEIVFCEAAARPGGGGIDDIVARTYGINLIKVAIEVQCGLGWNPAPESATPGRTAGVLGIYHTGQDVPASDVVTAVPGVVSYSFSAQPIPGVVRHCTDYAHKVVIMADSREQFDLSAQAVAAVIEAAPARLGGSRS